MLYTISMTKTKKEKEKSFRHELINQLVTLSTSGFGLVAALAWNDAVQLFVQEYIQYYFPNQSGIISKFIYALLITFLAVIITYQLSRLSAETSDKN